MTSGMETKGKRPFGWLSSSSRHFVIRNFWPIFSSFLKSINVASYRKGLMPNYPKDENTTITILLHGLSII